MTESAGQRRPWTNERFDAEFPHLTRLGDVTGNAKTVLVRGECGHEWMGRPNGFLRGTGCFICNIGAPWTNERFDREITHVTRLGDVTRGNKNTVLVRGECGHEWEASPNSLSQGTGCFICKTALLGRTSGSIVRSPTSPASAT